MKAEMPDFNIDVHTEIVLEYVKVTNELVDKATLWEGMRGLDDESIDRKRLCILVIKELGEKLTHLQQMAKANGMELPFEFEMEFVYPKE